MDYLLDFGRDEGRELNGIDGRRSTRRWTFETKRCQTKSRGRLFLTLVDVIGIQSDIRRRTETGIMRFRRMQVLGGQKM